MILETKDSHLGISMGARCRLLGLSRQAYYQHQWRSLEVNLGQDLVLQQVRSIRKEHPAIGTRKLFAMLKPFLAEHKIKIGRDALFDLLAEYKLLIIKRRRKIRTTFSAHGMRKYPNLIKDLTPVCANKIWVSDITYYKIGHEHVYISFITDAYSRKIVGYQVADSLHAVNCVKALQMAIREVNTNIIGLIHHSDRGSQYCSAEYIAVLEKHKIAISMTETSDPRDNAIAERVNGIIKEEYLAHYLIKTKKEIEEKLHQAVYNYNHHRPHLSCNMNAPADVHQSSLITVRLWKNYYKKPIIVNVKQDCPETVNQYQDSLINL